MRIFLFILLSFSFTKTILGQTSQDTSGFTNRAEAKNELVNGLKEGKWCEYLELIPVGKRKHQNFSEVITTDTSKAIYYRLTYYRNGKPFGIERQYYMNGALEAVLNYADGKREGIATGYYPDGKIAFENPFKEDKREGTCKLFYESGKVKSEITYSADKLVAIKNYDENGKIIK